MLIRSVSYKRIKGIAALILSIYAGVAARASIGYIIVSNLLITASTTNTTTIVVTTIDTTVIIATTTTTSIDYREKENR
ncbi:hypothetical protein P8C59_000064 [Phyllachora maydis]|uniref:Uncharacterized protein n=1 Tax=Phyllachora maydis TaxID=1825666 RepID=A0AAD9HV19_9PEZI|nr:hypothetical protein P8C59_000064 [Phyllachora maydis]